jgi:hypothetical protein
VSGDAAASGPEKEVLNKKLFSRLNKFYVNRKQRASSLRRTVSDDRLVGRGRSLSIEKPDRSRAHSLGPRGTHSALLKANKKDSRKRYQDMTSDSKPSGKARAENTDSYDSYASAASPLRHAKVHDTDVVYSNAAGSESSATKQSGKIHHSSVKKRLSKLAARVLHLRKTEKNSK